MPEAQVFPVPPRMAGAYISSQEQYERLYHQSIGDPETFWGKIAEDFYWEKKWDKACVYDYLCACLSLCVYVRVSVCARGSKCASAHFGMMEKCFFARPVCAALQARRIFTK